MQPIEIIVIILVALFFIGYIGSYLYKKKHNMPTGECASCHMDMKRAMKKAKKACNKMNCSCNKYSSK